MKRIIFTVVIFSCCTLQLQLASAQTAEIQQLLLNVEKLAQLKSILSNMKKGYETISNGYGRIKQITEGNFSLHQAFLHGLLGVNPSIAKYKKVPAIIKYQYQILSEYRAAFNQFKSGGRFTQSQLENISRVYNDLFDRSLEDLDELTLVITASKLRMSDDERIAAIDRIYDNMKGKLSFLRGFNRRTADLDRQLEKQLKEADVLRQMTGQ